MDPNPEDRVGGWTAQQVSTWKIPAREVQLGYYQAVKAAAQQYISSLSDPTWRR
jgi:hypothetical protein